MTTAEAGRLMGWTDSKMSRIETANMRIPQQDVAPLLKHYGMTEPDVVAQGSDGEADAGRA
ncbi:helix-turn-helix domain-containing protein [Streptomyces blattellae]|uniref:helix-turn-helix domain-containing protein n=1 Tax=Streptomyces blattellae TaxID=2569855 RepID=UPI0012B73C11